MAADSDIGFATVNDGTPGKDLSDSHRREMDGQEDFKPPSDKGKVKQAGKKVRISWSHACGVELTTSSLQLTQTTLTNLDKITSPLGVASMSQYHSLHEDDLRLVASESRRRHVTSASTITVCQSTP